MILLKSTLAGVAAFITAALATYGLAVGLPHILELMPNREGFMGVFQFPMWQLAVAALLIFSGGSTGVSAAPCAIVRWFRKETEPEHAGGDLREL